MKKLAKCFKYFAIPLIVIYIIFYMVVNYKTHDKVTWQSYNNEIWKKHVQNSKNYYTSFYFMQSICNGIFSNKTINLLLDWNVQKEKICDNFYKFGNKFAILKNVFLVKEFGSGRQGNESIMSVINQSEDAEYWSVSPGFFQFNQSVCKITNQYFEPGENHLNTWLNSVVPLQTKFSKFSIVTNPTFIIQRFEYVNLYHTTTDWYNCFLTLEFFNISQSNVSVILLDGHPAGNLDNVWKILFPTVWRISSLDDAVFFQNLLWVAPGYQSPMMMHDFKDIPLLNEFRVFFLKSFNLKDRELDCKNFKITFVWRKDYLAHPRNPSGHVQRKIYNEKQLLKHIKKHKPFLQIRGYQMDVFDMRMQLKIISNTDLLIGMHGAGLTHAVFLPRKSGLLEFVPQYFNAFGNHFESIARWRGLYYDLWVNMDSQLEYPNHRTQIPVRVALSMIEKAYKNMCPDIISSSVAV